MIELYIYDIVKLEVGIKLHEKEWLRVFWVIIKKFTRKRYVKLRWSLNSSTLSVFLTVLRGTSCSCTQDENDD